MRAESRLPALDGLRGVAILLVLMNHFTAFPPDVPLSRTLYQVAYFGWAGVDLFFVLSGFLITGILFDTKGSAHYFRNFYMRRVLRIFPLYYGVLVVLFVLVPLVHQYAPVVQQVADRQGWLWLYGVNLNIALEGKWLFGGDWLELGHFWSLAVQEHFYLLWPALVLLLNRRSLMLLCGLSVPVALGIRVALLKAGMDPAGAYVLTPCRMDSLALGGLLAPAVRGPGGIGALLPAARWSAAGSAAALLAIFLAQGSSNENGFVVQTLGYPLLAVCFGSVLLLSLDPSETSVARRLFSLRLLRPSGPTATGSTSST
jgi:peptidoglycan/LPS O-acetylase OafA/YrhL